MRVQARNFVEAIPSHLGTRSSGGFVEETPSLVGSIRQTKFLQYVWVPYCTF